MRYQELPELNYHVTTTGGNSTDCVDESDCGYVTDEYWARFEKKLGSAQKKNRKIVKETVKEEEPDFSDETETLTIDYGTNSDSSEFSEFSDKSDSSEDVSDSDSSDGSDWELTVEDRRKRARDHLEAIGKLTRPSITEDLDNIVSDTQELQDSKAGAGEDLYVGGKFKAYDGKLLPKYENEVIYHCEYCNDDYKPASVSRHVATRKHKLNMEKVKKS